MAAVSTALSKPNDWEMKLMSLSMVLGMPMTLICSPRRETSPQMEEAAFMLPSPPITKSMLTLSRSSASTISPGSCGPREEPSTVPPKL